MSGGQQQTNWRQIGIAVILTLIMVASMPAMAASSLGGTETTGIEESPEHIDGVDLHSANSTADDENETDTAATDTVTSSDTVTYTDTVLGSERLRNFEKTYDIDLQFADDEYRSMDDDGFDELELSDPYFDLDIENVDDIDVSNEFNNVWLRFDAYHGTRPSGDLYPVLGPSYSDVQGLDNVYWSEERLERDDASTSYETHAIRLDTGDGASFTNWLDSQGSADLHFYQTVDEGATTSGWRVKNAQIDVPLVDTKEEQTSEDVTPSIPDDTEYLEDVFVQFDYELHDGNLDLYLYQGDQLWVSPTDLDGTSGTHERWISPTSFDDSETPQLQFEVGTGTGGAVGGGDVTISNVEIEWIVNEQPFEIDANPSDADIYVDGRHVGSGTATVDRSPLEEYDITVERDGYIDETFEQVSPPETFDVDLEPETDELSVTSTPDNADVYLDGEQVGTTPWSDELPVTESYTLEVDKDDYEAETRSGVSPPSDEDITLDPKTDTIEVTAEPSGGEVYIDDEYVGTAPVTETLPITDSYDIRVEFDDYETETFDSITPPDNVHADPDPETDELTVTSTPENANVYLDGEQVGTTPWSDELPVTESYTLEIDKDGYNPEIRTDVSSPDTIQVDLDEEADDPFFDVSISETNDPVEAGETLAVDVDVENTGDRSDTQALTVDAGALGDDTTSVSLDGGEETTETVTIPTGSNDDGEYSVTASSEDTSDTQSVIVEDPDPGEAVFETSISETNAPIQAGEELSVTAELENTGDEPGTQSVDLTVDGLGTDTTSVSLDPGGTTTASFSVSTTSDDAGSYTATVTSEDTSDSQTVTVEEDSDDDPFFDVSIAETNAPVTAGDSLTADVDVENTGGDGTTSVELFTDDSATPVDAATVDLDTGASTQVTLTYETDDADAPEVTLEAVPADDGTADDQTVIVEERPVIAAERHGPEAVIPGETVEIETRAHVHEAVDEVTFFEAFTPSFDTTQLQDVRIEGESGTPETSNTTRPSGLVVTFDSAVDADRTATVVYTVAVPADAEIGEEYIISGDVSGEGEEEAEPDDTVLEVVEPSVEQYENEAGVVDTNGVRDAISNWQDETIDTELLIEVIDAWSE